MIKPLDNKVQNKSRQTKANCQFAPSRQPAATVATSSKDPRSRSRPTARVAVFCRGPGMGPSRTKGKKARKAWMWREGSEQSVPRFSLCLSVLVHRPLIVVFSSSMFLFPPLQGAEPNQPYDNVSLLIIEPSGSTGKQQPLRSSLIHPILLVVLFRRLGRNPPAWPPAHLPTCPQPTPPPHTSTTLHST